MIVVQTNNESVIGNDNCVSLGQDGGRCTNINRYKNIGNTLLTTIRSKMPIISITKATMVIVIMILVTL